jgi:hypothetical protein
VSVFEILFRHQADAAAIVVLIMGMVKPADQVALTFLCVCVCVLGERRAIIK